jgi:kynurenine 3-monooxygenase
MQLRAVIVGAGPVGCLVGGLLASKGFTVVLYEKRSNFFRDGMASEGRTIGLSVSPRGLRALAELGCKDALLTLAVPMDSRVIHTDTGRTLMKYSREEWRNYSVSRNELNLALLRKTLRHDAVRVHFETTCKKVDLEAKIVTFATNDGRCIKERYDLLVGADGAFSVVREHLANNGVLSFEQTLLPMSYKELTLRPPWPGSDLRQSAIHVWPRRGYFMVALPCSDHTFKCTLVLPSHGTNSFERLNAQESLREFMRQNFADEITFLDQMDQEFARNPRGRIVTVSCSALHYGQSVLLIGDAAHTVAPFLGQGINLGFEDCKVFKRLLDLHERDLAAALMKYGRDRKANGDAAAALSMVNYAELSYTDMLESGSGVESDRERISLFPPQHSDLPLPLMVNFLDLTYTQVLERMRLTSENRWRDTDAQAKASAVP